MKALFDTNILIDYLNGIEEARLQIQRYESTFISIISLMEVMVDTNKDDEEPVKAFLSRFTQSPIFYAINILPALK